MTELDPGRVLAAVARVAGVDVGALTRTHPALRDRGRYVSTGRTAPRLAAAYLLRHRSRLTYHEIGRRLRCDRSGAWWMVCVFAKRSTAAQHLIVAAEIRLARPEVDVEALLRRAREDAQGPAQRRRP